MKQTEFNDSREIALTRFRILGPLLDEGLSACERREIRAHILRREGISERTLRRWLASYRQQDFDGLLPKARSDKGQAKALTPEALALAVELRKEVPARSAERIRQMLAHHGHQAARSTLERHLRQSGHSGRTLRKTGAQAGRRFVRSGRNTLWQADLKYGPYLPDPAQPGKKKRSYLVAIVDDATRKVVHAEFYDNQKLPALEDCLKKALLTHGIPGALYVDNGQIFVSQWMRLACAKLGIRHITTRPYSPESKGKIERFNRTAEEFFREVRLEKAESLAKLNALFRLWLQEGYHHRPHSSLSGKSPAQTFQEDAKPIRYPSPEALRDAFLWEAARQVDKSGCFKLEGRLYEAGVEWMRKRILVRYDPFDLSCVEVWHEGEKRKVVEIARIGEYNQALKQVPEALEKSSGSRMLQMLAETEKKRLKRQLSAFRLAEGVNEHV